MNDLYVEKDKMFCQMNLETEVPGIKWYSGIDVLTKSEGHTNATSLFMMSNRGMTYRLASENPNHKHKFEEMGVKPEFMFGCAFRAIFSPTEQLIKRNEIFLKVYLSLFLFQTGA